MRCPTNIARGSVGFNMTPMIDVVFLLIIFFLVASHLSQKERIIITLYYYEGLSMKEIAKVLRLTESRICQIHGKVVTRLREQLQRTRATLFV